MIRWYRADIEWWEADWLQPLSDGAQLVYNKLQSYCKIYGVKGRFPVVSVEKLASKIGSRQESVEELLNAAFQCGMIVRAEDCYVLTDWERTQEPTSAQREAINARVRKHREKKISVTSETSVTSYPVTRDVVVDVDTYTTSSYENDDDNRALERFTGEARAAIKSLPKFGRIEPHADSLVRISRSVLGAAPSLDDALAELGKWKSANRGKLAKRGQGDPILALDAWFGRACVRWIELQREIESRGAVVLEGSGPPGGGQRPLVEIERGLVPASQVVEPPSPETREAVKRRLGLSG